MKSITIANDKNTFRKKPPPAYRFRYKIPKNEASFAVQPLWLTIESERNFENRYNITVRGYHIGHFGHVNHGRYVELLEEARWCYLEENNLFESIHETVCSWDPVFRQPVIIYPVPLSGR